MKKLLSVLLLILVLPAFAALAEPAEDSWIPAEDAAVTEEAARLVTEGLNGMVGVDYAPVAFLGSRTDGEATAHAILCQARVVVPDAKPRWVVIYVSEDAWGGATLLHIAEFDIGALWQGAY